METTINKAPGKAFPDEQDYHGHPKYGKVFLWLLILLTFSLVVGFFTSPLIAVILIFIVAVIKSGMVVANFMHLKFEPKLLWLLVGIAIFIFLAFYFGVFPDIVPIERHLAK